MARKEKKIHPDQILGRKSDYDKPWGRIAAEDLGDVEHQLMVRQVEKEASKLPTKRERQKYIHNKLKSINELLVQRGLLWKKEDPRFQREYAQEYLGVTPQLKPGDILRKNRASNLSSGSRDSALQIVEQSIKKGGKVKRKRKKKKVSRKKIMVGYKAGGKV
jgi:hypothetical protein